MGANEKEIERKYLLRGLPAGVESFASFEIDQGYLPGVCVRERVRRIDDRGSLRYVRTIKVGTGMERFEFEEDTTQAFFDAVWPLTEGHRVRKRRYHVPSDGLVWEIDEFLDREGLYLAEIELSHVDQAPTPPREIAAVIVREVTNAPSFSNYT